MTKNAHMRQRGTVPLSDTWRKLESGEESTGVIKDNGPFVDEVFADTQLEGFERQVRLDNGVAVEEFNPRTHRVSSSRERRICP